MATIKSLENGKVYDIPDDKLAGAEEAGFKILTPEERQKEIDISKASVAGGLLEKVLSAATFSGSRYLEKKVADAFDIPSLGQEAQKTRAEAVEKYEPELGVASEIAGVAAPIILSAGTATPEVVALEGAGAAARAGKTALTVADAFNPVGAVSKLGTATTELVSPKIAAKVAGLAETSPRIAQTITKAGSAATGGALEGAAFGVSNALDENALGSEESLGEAMLHHAGIGSLLGGGAGAIFGGLGGVFGGLEKATEKANKSVKPADIVEKMGEIPKSVEDALLTSADTEAKKTSFLGGLKEQKDHAQQIIKDGEDLGLEVFPNQTSKSKDIQIGFEAVSKSPSLVGNYVRKQLGAAWEKLANIVTPIVETGETRTALQIGEDLQASILKKADDMIESYKAKYNELGLTEKVIPVSEKTTMRVAKNLNKLSDIRDGHAPSEVYQIIKLLDRADNTLENITGMQKALNSYIYNPMNDANKRRIAGYVKSRVDAIYENTIKKQFSKKDQKELFALYRDARKEFAQSIEHFSDVSGATGKSKIRSPLSFVEHFKNNINAESLVKKLFKKDNFRFVESFKNKFPKEWEMIKNYQKKNMMVIEDNTLNVKRTLNNIDKLSPEMKNLLFSPEQIKTLQKANTWIEAFPKEFNPSRSGSMVEWTMGSVPFVLNNFKDAIKMAGIAGIHASAHDLPKSIVSSKIFKVVQNINNSVKETSSYILGKGEKYAPAVSSAFAHDHESTEEIMDKVKKAYEDVHGLNQSMANGSAIVSQYAPQTVNGFNTKSALAVSHLYSKIPKYNYNLLDKKQKPSKSQTFKFNLHLKAIQDPFKTMKKAKHGSILPEEMETLKAIYPDLLQKTQLAIMNEMQGVIDNPDKLSYQQKIGLSTLLEKPLVSSLNPQSIAMNQIKTQNQQQEQIQKGIAKAPQLNNSYKTSFQRSSEDMA